MIPPRAESLPDPETYAKVEEIVSHLGYDIAEVLTNRVLKTFVEKTFSIATHGASLRELSVEADASLGDQADLEYLLPHQFIHGQEDIKLVDDPEGDQ